MDAEFIDVVVGLDDFNEISQISGVIDVAVEEIAAGICGVPEGGAGQIRRAFRCTMQELLRIDLSRKIEVVLCARSVVRVAMQ